MNLSLQIDGIAFYSPFAPTWPDARAVMRGESELLATPAGRPQNGVLAPTERRRAPDTVAVALYLAEAASMDANRAPTDMASVFASAYGDLAINDYMCETLATTPRMISPTKFHNSVHNAAAGYWTIGTGCRKASTALAAARASFAEALLEAAVQVTTDTDPVLLVCYDIEARGPLSEVCKSTSVFGNALVLSRPDPARSGARMQLSITDEGSEQPAVTALAARHSDHPMRSSFVLFEALARGTQENFFLQLDGGRNLQVRVTP